MCHSSRVTTRRWDGDERGTGVADAVTFAAGAAELVDAMRRPEWVAEEPELHLLPHVDRACAALPLELVESGTSPDGAFELRLRSTQPEASLGQVRAAVFAVLGSFAEPASYVRQRGTPDKSPEGELRFEVVTGFLRSDTAFLPHGHTVRITVSTV